MFGWREYVMVAGTVVFATGLTCLPGCSPLGPKREQGGFYRLADTGAFWQLGVGLIVAGLAIFFLSFFLPSGDD